MTRTKPRAWLFYAVLAAVSNYTIQGQVLPDALLLLPGDTKSVEYDNLGELRRVQLSDSAPAICGPSITASAA
jgi:hypothetical protein